MAAEVADGGDAVGDVEQQIAGVEQVDVQVGQAGHEKPPAAVDPQSAGGRGRSRRFHRPDPALPHDHGAVGQNPAGAELHDRDVLDRERRRAGLAGLGIGSRGEQGGQHERGENRGREAHADTPS